MAKLGDVFNLQMGKTPARANLAYWTDGTNEWVSIADLSSYEKYVEGTKEKITDLAVQESGIKKISANTVIMSFKLSLGKTAITKTPVYTNEAIMAFLPSGKYDVCPDYFFYLFSGKDWSEGTNRAVMGATLNKATLRNIEIDVPPLDEQRRIAAILDKVTDLINKHRAQLDKLDLLVKSRFVEMFGTENEFGRWPCGKVGDVADVCVGVVIKPTQYYAEEGVKAFRSLNIGAMYVKDNDWVYFSQEGHLKNQKSAIRKGDVLVVRSGAPGIACVATEEYDGCNAVDIIIARPDTDKIEPVFLAMFTNLPHGMNQIRERTGGAAQQHFNVGGYKALTLIMPPLDLQKQFALFFTRTSKTKLMIQQGLDELEMLKKAFLQKYFA